MTLGSMVPADLAEIEQVLGPFLESMQDAIQDIWPSVDSELVLLHLLCVRFNLHPPTWWPHWAKRPIIACPSRPASHHFMSQLEATGIVQSVSQRTQIWSPNAARLGHVTGSTLGTGRVGAPGRQVDDLLVDPYQELDQYQQYLNSVDGEVAEVACKEAQLKSTADANSSGRAWDWNRLSPEPGAEPSPTPKDGWPRAAPIAKRPATADSQHSEPHAEPQRPHSAPRRPQSARVYQRVSKDSPAQAPPSLRNQRPLSASTWVRIPRAVHRPRDRPYSTTRRITETPDARMSRLGGLY